MILTSLKFSRYLCHALWIHSSIRMQTMPHLNCNLEAIETSCLWNLDFLAETLDQVFIHNTVAGSEEGKHMLDEIPFIILRQRKKCVMIRLGHHIFICTPPHSPYGWQPHGPGPVGKFFQGSRACTLPLHSKQSKNLKSHRKFSPVIFIFGKIDFFCCPEGGCNKNKYFVNKMRSKYCLLTCMVLFLVRDLRGDLFQFVLASLLYKPGKTSLYSLVSPLSLWSQQTCVLLGRHVM